MSHKMIDTPTSNAKYYEIRLKGHLEARWADWFDGLTIMLKEDGDKLIHEAPVIVGCRTPSAFAHTIFY